MASRAKRARRASLELGSNTVDVDGKATNHQSRRILPIVRDAEGWVCCDVLIDHQQKRSRGTRGTKVDTRSARDAIKRRSGDG